MNSRILIALVCIVAIILGGYIMGWFSQAARPAQQQAVDNPQEAPDETSIVSDSASGNAADNEAGQAAAGGDAPPDPVELTTPKELCQALCMEMLAAGDDLNRGPCLSNAILPGWVCDVAHSPRAGVDNIPANQCAEFGKSASHFVEVGPQCAFIREA